MIEVTYIDHMGNDLSVVNAARVSFGKKSKLECIDMVKERQYDMILMDCSMPIVSGFEATQKIRGLVLARYRRKGESSL